MVIWERLRSRAGRAGAGLAVAVALSVVAGAAQACMPAPHEAERVMRAGEKCAVSYADSEYTTQFINEAEDLGAGFVRQEIGEGFGCYVGGVVLIMDCTNGDAAVVGPYFDAFPGLSVDADKADMTGRLNAVLERADKLRKAGTPLRSADLVAEAQRAGLTDTALARLGQKVGYNDKASFAIGCGCKLYYGSGG